MVYTYLWMSPNGIPKIRVIGHTILELWYLNSGNQGSKAPKLTKINRKILNGHISATVRARELRFWHVTEDWILGKNELWSAALLFSSPFSLFRRAARGEVWDWSWEAPRAGLRPTLGTSHDQSHTCPCSHVGKGKTLFCFMFLWSRCSLKSSYFWTMCQKFTEKAKKLYTSAIYTAKLMNNTKHMNKFPKS